MRLDFCSVLTGPVPGFPCPRQTNYLYTHPHQTVAAGRRLSPISLLGYMLVVKSTHKCAPPQGFGDSLSPLLASCHPIPPSLGPGTYLLLLAASLCNSPAEKESVGFFFCPPPHTSLQKQCGMAGAKGLYVFFHNCFCCPSHAWPTAASFRHHCLGLLCWLQPQVHPAVKRTELSSSSRKKVLSSCCSLGQQLRGVPSHAHCHRFSPPPLLRSFHP